MNFLVKSMRNGALLFFLLPVIYFGLFGSFGFADTDQGFIPALSYRIHSGQVPYLDFDYVRPPITPYLHHLEMYLPDAWEMRAMRFNCYLMIWASVLFSLLAFKRHFDLEELGLRPWLFASLAFVLTAHNFPAMPWHTVDGVFLGSLGIFFFSMPKKGLTLGLFFFFLAAMAKQPFALLFPIGCVMAFQLHSPKKAILGILATLAIIALIALRIQVTYPGFLQAMLAQITGTTTVGDLFASGIKTYFLPLALFIVPSLLIFRFSKDRLQLRKLLSWALIAGLALFPLAHAGLSLYQQSFQPMRLGIYHALLMAAMLLAYQLLREKDWPKFSLFLMMIVLAWSSGISWGYAVPVLYAFPGLAALLIFLRRDLGFDLGGWKMPSLIGITFLGFFLMQLFPYRDAPRWELTENAGQVFDRLDGIYTSKDNLVRLKELAFLDKKCAQHFVVLPAMPAAHYLTKTKPVIGIDWTHDGEMQPKRIQENYQLLRASKVAVLVENSREEEAIAKKPQYRSTLLKLVLENYVRADWHPYGYYSVYLPKE